MGIVTGSHALKLKGDFGNSLPPACVSQRPRDARPDPFLVRRNRPGFKQLEALNARMNKKAIGEGVNEPIERRPTALAATDDPLHGRMSCRD